MYFFKNNMRKNSIFFFIEDLMQKKGLKVERCKSYFYKKKDVSLVSQFKEITVLYQPGMTCYCYVKQL